MRNSRLVQVSIAVAMFGSFGAARAAPCAAASLSAYQALGAAGCSIGSLTFSDFLVEPFPGPGATQIGPAGISVTPLANGFALSSTAPIAAAVGELLGLRFLFDVGAPALIGATVALGDAAVEVDGDVTGFLDAGSAGNAIAVVIEGLSGTPASFASAPRASYAAFFELGIDGGTEGSASLGPTLASLTFVQGTVAAVPEPGTAALSLLGLAALLARRRLRPS